MHDNSLPRGDQVESLADAASFHESRAHRLVIVLADGTYFRAWSRRRGCFSVCAVSKAMLFALEPRDAIDRVIAKLQCAGIAARAIEVNIRIGLAAAT